MWSVGSGRAGFNGCGVWLGSCGLWALEHRFSSCGAWALLPCSIWGSSQTRDRIRVSCIGGRILSRWATREAPNLHFIIISKMKLSPMVLIFFPVSWIICSIFLICLSIGILHACISCQPFMISYTFFFNIPFYAVFTFLAYGKFWKPSEHCFMAILGGWYLLFPSF